MKERPETDRAGMPHEAQSGPMTFKASGVSFKMVHKAKLGCGIGLLGHI